MCLLVTKSFTNERPLKCFSLTVPLFVTKHPMHVNKVAPKSKVYIAIIILHMLSNCWGNQAQLKQPCCFYSEGRQNWDCCTTPLCLPFASNTVGTTYDLVHPLSKVVSWQTLPNWCLVTGSPGLSGFVPPNVHICRHWTRFWIAISIPDSKLYSQI